MRRRYSLFYFIGQGFQGIFRNGVMSFASVAVLTSCLLVLGAFTLLVQNINVNLEEFGLLNEIVVFVDRDADEAKIQEIEAEILALDNVADVKRTTKAEALESMKEQSEEYKHLYEDIDETNNPLTDKFTITYEDNDRVVTLAYLLGQIDGVRKVRNDLDLAVTISNVKNAVLLIFTWFLIILFVVSLFVITNTIKLSVFSRRNEISIMRYVGATNWFITLPFLIEGFIIGLASSVAAYFAEMYLYHYVQTKALSDLEMISVIPAETVQMPLLWAFLAIGVLSGVVGSCISLGKHMKA